MLEHCKTSSDLGIGLPCLLRTGQKGLTRTPTLDTVPWLDTLPGSALWYLALGKYTTVCTGHWMKDHTASVHFCEPGRGSPKSDVLFESRNAGPGPVPSLSAKLVLSMSQRSQGGQDGCVEPQSVWLC